MPVSVDVELVEAALPAYELGEELGRGSCGVVFTATHKRLDRTVAIKELPPAFAAEAEVRLRFAAEGKLLASFDHPHIVPIYDYVEDHGVCLLVMEYMPGGNVWTRFSTEGFRFEASIAIALATALALQYAHDRGVLHRDIKPDNLLFSKTGAVKVSDFGLAKVMGGAAMMMTRTGQVLGTPAYIAPEQALAESITPATDVYSLGVMLFELLAGDLPFHDDGNPVTLLLSHVNETPRDLAEFAPDVPSPLTDIVMRAISRDPADRHPSAWEFAAELNDAANELWGPTWLDRAGIPVDPPDRLASRRTLQASPKGGLHDPVKSVAVFDGPRRSKRMTTASGRVELDPETGDVARPNAPDAPAADLAVEDVVPVDEFLGGTASPAGAWHPDPWGTATWRWWDGTQWTHHTS